MDTKKKKDRYCGELRQVVGNGRVILLYSPESFIDAGRFYGEFGQVSDKVIKIMKRHGHEIKYSDPH